MRQPKAAEFKQGDIVRIADIDPAAPPMIVESNACDCMVWCVYFDEGRIRKIKLKEVILEHYPTPNTAKK